MNWFIKYFFRGLFIAAPLALTVYIMIVSVKFMDSLLPLKIPGLGLLILLSVITLLGFLTSLFLGQKLVGLFDRLIVRIPLVNILYTSIRDLVGAFVGDKKKFNRPILVSLNSADRVYKLGFVTDDDLSTINMEGFVSVYLPHSYNFSGNHFLVHSSNIVELNISGVDAMKYIVSGGVAHLTENNGQKKDDRSQDGT